MAKAEGNRGLITVSVIVYLLCLIALMPLNVVYRILAPMNLPVEVLAVSGTLWQGQIVAKHEMTGQITSQWALKPASLLAGDVKAQVKIDGALFEVNSLVTVNPLGQSAQLQNTKGFVSSNLINQFLVGSKTQINGDLELNNINLQYDFVSGESDTANGQLLWTGGQVNYPKGSKIVSANLPMLVAKLNSENNELQAEIATTEGLQVATAGLKKDGWANIAVRKAMVDLVGEKWPNKVSADAVIFELSERVFSRSK